MPKTKQYIAAKADIDDNERTVTAVVSTGGVDRDNEVLLPKGALLDNYKKNPVVLWAHNSWETPIGKNLWIKRKGNDIIAKTKFAETEKANEVYELFKGGFLNAFSIGFMPIKGHRPEPDDIKKRPDLAEATYIYDKWELLEYSVVPVPANAEALATAVKTKSIVLSDGTKNEMELEEEVTIFEEPIVEVVKEPIREPIHLIETMPVLVKLFVPTAEPKKKTTPFDPEAEAIRILKRIKGSVY